MKNQVAYVQANGLNMVYGTYGEGISVILLHGGLETCQMWVTIILLLPKSHQVFTPDSRGHGRKGNPSGKFGFHLLAEDIVFFIDALGLQDPLVVGYSNCGQTALHMAMIHPGLVRGYMIGAVYNSMMSEWRRMMRGSLGFEGPGIVDLERVMKANAEFD